MVHLTHFFSNRGIDTMQLFFEGTEKLLEIWFGFSKKSRLRHCDLRLVPRPDWDDLLCKVGCSVLNCTSNKSIDSYLLSESSMFISTNRLILKTCGQTTLLDALPDLLKLVIDKTGFDHVEDFFYSHGKFMRPDLQPSVHHCFDAETRQLDTIFPNGFSLELGGYWHLYTLNQGAMNTDQTLEVIMTGLDTSIVRLFYKKQWNSVKDLDKALGIQTLVSDEADFAIDSYLFHPCGYSVNGIAETDRYFTIHVTPQLPFSYVSFETNVFPGKCYQSLLVRILELFQPAQFAVTLFTDKGCDAENCHKCLSKWQRLAADYKQQQLEFRALPSTDLSYSHYVFDPA